MILFGPIPSRRLGRSLGINNIPPKICSYACIYCQIGITNSMSITRQEFYSPDRIFAEAKQRIDEILKTGEKIDYLTFVPDGEPTLDINLGKTIIKLKEFGIKIAVITNSSLLWDEEVREDLMNADWVSVKIDTVYEDVWHKINRPHGRLSLRDVIQGIEQFAFTFNGRLVTETMLVKGMNDDSQSLGETAKIIGRVNPHKAFILIPTRPTTETFAQTPSDENINMAFQIFSKSVNNVELVIGNEGTDFTYSSDAEKELLSILAVHPMRRDAIDSFLLKANSNWEMINNLIEKEILREVEFSGNNFIIKKI